MKNLVKIHLSLFALLVGHLSSHAGDTPFYKNEMGRFSLRPSAEGRVYNLTRFGPVGLSLDFVQPAFTIKINEVEPGSPADKTGQLKSGQYIQSINGETLKDIDPRIQLGNLITKAEASDGQLHLKVADEPNGPARDVLVQLEVLGSYSETWPMDCPKSDRIVRNFAEYLKTEGNDQGFADIGMLFLLSTGDPSDLEYVARWAKKHKGNKGYPWHIGYGGLALCEYYLRTGDADVLPAMQQMADRLVEMENFGGWVGRGGIAQLSYGGGGGHLNAAGTHCLTYLLLASECGINVPAETLERVLVRFYRYSARGNVPYGMGRPERGFTDNGKNGKLTFAMAAAANLTPGGEQSIYAKARDASAQFSFYSTSYMLHGHTGGGIGEIWRSAAMGLLHDKLSHHYREFMEARRWHYEMSRRFDGSFAILGGDRYDEASWGAAYALAYTVPRGNLRLFGAPASKWSKTIQLPEQPWGTAEDDEFQSIEPAVMPDGTRPDISKETFVDDSAVPLLHKLNQTKDLDTFMLYLHHPDYVYRSAAAKGIATHHPEKISGLLEAEDARVRRAALEGIEATGNQLITRGVFDKMVAMTQDPKESWFIQELAIQLIGGASDDWIVTVVDKIIPFLKHEEWWFQDAAVRALVPVVADERCYQKVLPALGELLQTNYRYNISSYLRWGSFAGNIRDASPEVQEMARQSLEHAYSQFVEYEHEQKRVRNTVNPMNRDMMVQLLSMTPGGFDTIYEMGRKKFPDQDLPYREVFLNADPDMLSPELRKIVNAAVGENLIPKYVAKHRETLLAEARSEANIRRPQMPGLIELYEKVGLYEHTWENAGPASEKMKWAYFSFDPKEMFMEKDDRLGRYREVTFPKGMENWYAGDFDPQAKGWKKGLAPFGAANGKLERIASGGPNCDLSFCGCPKPLNTLWENDVLLIRGEFEFPPFEVGYRYRLVHGGISHVGLGGGFRLYVNGKLFYEDTTGVDRRGGGRPEGRIIPAEWWPEFEGPVQLAAITFKKNHPRTKKFGGNIDIFLQRQKVPPIESIAPEMPAVADR